MKNISSIFITVFLFSLFLFSFSHAQPNILQNDSLGPCYKLGWYTAEKKYNSDAKNTHFLIATVDSLKKIPCSDSALTKKGYNDNRAFQKSKNKGALKALVLFALPLALVVLLVKYVFITP